MAGGDDFSWKDLDDSEMLTHGVKPTAVYFNTRGDIVVRQERDWNEDEDTVLVLPLEYAERLALRLQTLIEEARAGRGPKGPL